MRLPIDCDVTYYPDLLSDVTSDSLLRSILSSCKLSNTIQMADGSQHILDVGKCMFADSNILHSDALPPEFGPRHQWFDELRDVKERIEAISGREYDVCVCIHYKNGESGVAFHSDLVAYGDVSSIASVSLGQTRRFVLRRQDDHADTCELELENGSLLLMGEHCQDRYEHSLPVDPTRTAPRINLTFRAFGWEPSAEPLPPTEQPPAPN